MKIMMLITGMQAGGAERVMSILCNELSQNNEIILCILKDSKSDYELNKNIKILSGEIKNKSLLKSVLFTNKVIDREKPDIILSFMNKSNIIALLTKKFFRKKVPVVIAERANPYYTSKSIKLLRKILYKKADGCVFQTMQQKEYYKNMLKCKSVLLNNPLGNDFHIDPYRGKREKRIVCTARLSAEKNQKLLIKSFSKITSKYPDYKLEIYGDGPLKSDLQKLIDALNLNDKIKLMGRRKDIIDCIKNAEIFVLPSNSEGMPNSLLEAMALGLACIATDCPIGGSAILVKNKKNGLLIPMNDEDKLSDAMEKLIIDKKLASDLRLNAEKIVAEYDTQKVCNEWEKYLKFVQKNEM